MIIEVEQEEDGRWLSEVPEIPGVMIYGNTRQEAILKVQALALRVMADKLEHNEMLFNMDNLFSVAWTSSRSILTTEHPLDCFDIQLFF